MGSRQEGGRREAFLCRGTVGSSWEGGEQEVVLGYGSYVRSIPILQAEGAAICLLLSTQICVTFGVGQIQVDASWLLSPYPKEEENLPFAHDREPAAAILRWIQYRHPVLSASN